MLRQLSIFIENKAGSFSKITSILARHGINIQSFCLSDASDFGILRIVVKRSDLAIDILRNHNYPVQESEVVGVKLENESGALNKVLTMLAYHDVRINYIYSFAASTDDGTSVVVFNSDNNRQLSELFSTQGFNLY